MPLYRSAVELKQLCHLIGGKPYSLIGKPNLNLRLASLRLK